MTQPDLMQQAQNLAHEIRQQNDEARLKFLPDFSGAITALQHAGLKVPRALRQLEAELFEEELEAKFDNMPV